jgi:MinD superfamily P-loop ATPase
MIVTVASGKGGTGKTTVACSLALVLPAQDPLLLDCDVEAPNAHLSLKPRFDQQQPVHMLIPEVDQERCTACGRCAEVCPFHAVVVLGGQALVFPELCHGCGSCARNCPEQAIREVEKPIGVLEGGEAAAGFAFAHGLLNIGEPMAVPVIRALKAWEAMPASSLVIRDAPPGTACPVVESMRGSDFILLVTEPTPFGLHDLKLAAEVARALGIPAGVIVNRDGIGDQAVDAYCAQAGLPILMRIPLSREIGAALARGETLVEAFPEYAPRFRALHDQIIGLAATKAEAANPAGAGKPGGKVRP